MRVVVNPTLRRRNSHPAQHINRVLSCFLIPKIAVAANALNQLVTNREGRVERRHRLLENHGYPVAAQSAHSGSRQLGKVNTIESNRPSRYAALAFGKQAHDGQRGHAFAAAGLANNAQRAPSLHGKADVINGCKFPAFNLEACRQTPHLEQGAHAIAPLATLRAA